MSGETLEDYFRRLSLDETQRKYLENIKDGKQVNREIEEAASFPDYTRQIFYIYEEICDSSPE